jgi:hypothetical protein
VQGAEMPNSIIIKIAYTHLYTMAASLASNRRTIKKKAPAANTFKIAQMSIKTERAIMKMHHFLVDIT